MKYLTDADAIDDVGRGLEDQLLKASRLLNEMADDVDILGESWSGENHDSFADRFDSDRERVAQSGLRLSRFVTSVRSAAKVYRAMEEDINGYEFK